MSSAAPARSGVESWSHFEWTAQLNDTRNPRLAICACLASDERVKECPEFLGEMNARPNLRNMLGAAFDGGRCGNEAFEELFGED
jgi:hypothetical protein